MSQEERVVIYRAASNHEAHLVCNKLGEEGIRAWVLEVTPDVPQMFLPLPEMAPPQVWVERRDAERACQILERYERKVEEGQVNEAVKNRSSLVDKDDEDEGQFIGTPGVFDRLRSMQRPLLLAVLIFIFFPVIAVLVYLIVVWLAEVFP